MEQQSLTIEKLIELIRTKHQENGIEIYAPATFTAISEFEKQMGFSLPSDFKEFYLLCNGFGCNEDIFNFLPLSEIRNHSQDYGPDWFYFSEYMIYSDLWGLRLTSSGIYEIFNGSFPRKAMTSELKHFIERFLKGDVFEQVGCMSGMMNLG